ncbi:arylsulfatase [Flavobacterium sp.]|uniref:sulfatase family protein n=1 Tax=Flavobacterium sp. TaxID=239 RepID=UPI002B8FE8F3|nr:arylsulfatase [Flavobacterium sp.]HSD05764.1 arylsulfatase [Flavobacterium sp.]
MTKNLILSTLILLQTTYLFAQKPNVVIIYADDIGYGDFHCYYPNNKLQTPNVDKLAKDGLLFTRAYTTAATCTPSRYSLLTGEYSWRQKGIKILPGNAPALIKSGRPTIASVFKNAGYETAVVGKWHLGLGDSQGPDWNTTIKETPNDVGFKYSFILPATGDRVPTVYIENSKVVNLDPKDPIIVDYNNKVGNEPIGREHPELLKVKHSHGHDYTIINGVGRIGYMSGGKAARWVDEDMADIFTNKAVGYIEKNKDKPFFLYFATHDIHVPRLPNQRFVGKSGLGARGDALLEFDWSVGEILKTLEKNGLSKNTLVILSSDNGPVVDDGYQDQSVELLGDHHPAGNLRGRKGGIFEAGSRVPFILRYSEKVKPGVSNALISQVDLIASLSALIGQNTPKEAVDSQNQLNALLGKDKVGRKELVTNSVGSYAIVEERFKYIAPTEGQVNTNTNAERGNSNSPQLYDLTLDVGEKNNLAEKEPETVKRLEKRLAEIRNK